MSVMPGMSRWRWKMEKAFEVEVAGIAALRGGDTGHRLVSPCPGWAWRSRWLAKNVGKKFGA
jgi:hypothetical protein